MKTRTIIFALATVIFAALASALTAFPPATHGTDALLSPYAGEQARKIKSLSMDDVEELLSGGGWGLAKPAELNGMPGPGHLLDMQNQIMLSAEQINAIRKIWTQMNAKARQLGKRYVALEAELGQKFATGRINNVRLKSMLAEIGAVRSELRYTHLAAHLESLPILRPEQVALYNRLRGYAGEGPCRNIPAGHNSAMWKKHHNCE